MIKLIKKSGRQLAIHLCQ